MLPAKSKSIHFENVPADVGSSLTFRQFDWPNFPFNWHYHPEVELTLIVRGRGLRFVGDSVEKFVDGDLCLIGTDTPHCWVSDKDLEPGVLSLVVHFRPDAWGEPFWKMPEMRGIAKLLTDARRGLQVTGTVRREVEKLFVIMQQEPPGSFMRFNTLLEMLHGIAQSQELAPLAASDFIVPVTAEANGKLGKILNYIQAHLGPDLTQSEVAKAVRLSPAAFSQFFRRNLGTSYVQYVNEIKIRNASRALIDTDQPITEIAYDAGFNNLSHFNAQFRRFRHISPRAFRQQAQSAERAGLPIDVNGASTSALGLTNARLKQDVTVHGKGTTFEGVRVGTEEPRPWLKHYGVSSALARHGMVHTGIAEAHAPYQIVRTNQTTSYFLACFGGRGQVLVDGRWRTVRPGLAFLLPEHLHTAFGALPGEAWRFAYVCYQHSPAQPAVRPTGSVSSPVVAEFDPEPLRLAIQGLTAECRGPNRPGQIDHWLELVQGYVLAFAQPSPSTSPVPALWLRVSARLAEPWNMESLAREAQCSAENLRRACVKELGRSPLQQLTSLRMRRATELLTTTPLTLNEIARAVGYPNPVAFSKEFKSNVGCRPSEYRKKAPLVHPAAPTRS
ncbi:MAG TPA: helix-turn-helix domain-containing protein [Verrucomicrobiae bacterium]|nr:helix-turn-helix domain-containing protein [Verrucomicrobiae bacterium]